MGCKGSQFGYYDSMKVRIGVDNSSLPRTGIARYSAEMIKRIPNIHPDLDVISLRGSGVELRQSANKIVSVSRKLYWENISLPHMLRNEGFDLYHCTKNFGMPILSGIPSVVTIHDIIPLILADTYAPSKLEQLYYQANLRIAIRRADLILTISKFSHDEIIRCFPYAKNKIEVIYLGCDGRVQNKPPSSVLQQVLAKHQIQRSYILVLGGTEPRKNVKNVLEMYMQYASELHVDVVVIGGMWRGKPIPVSNIKGVHWLGSVEEEELRALYCGAEVFVFPSLYEGFGLPVLEAMGYGTPVVAASLTSVPEVVGSAGLLIDPADSQAMYEAVRQIINDKGLRDDLVARGYEQVQRFSWDETAKKTGQIYKWLLQK